MRFVEVCCSSPNVHRTRLEARRRGIAGFPEPSWADVEACRARFEPWQDERLTLDSMAEPAANIELALGYVAG